MLKCHLARPCTWWMDHLYLILVYPRPLLMLSEMGMYYFIKRPAFFPSIYSHILAAAASFFFLSVKSLHWNHVWFFPHLSFLHLISCCPQMGHFVGHQGPPCYFLLWPVSATHFNSFFFFLSYIFPSLVLPTDANVSFQEFWLLRVF